MLQDPAVLRTRSGGERSLELNHSRGALHVPSHELELVGCLIDKLTDREARICNRSLGHVRGHVHVGCGALLGSRCHSS